MKQHNRGVIYHIYLGNYWQGILNFCHHFPILLLAGNDIITHMKQVLYPQLWICSLAGSFSKSWKQSINEVAKMPEHFPKPMAKHLREASKENFPGITQHLEYLCILKDTFYDKTKYFCV